MEELPSELRREILIGEDAKPPVKAQLELQSEEENRVLNLLKIDEATQFDKIFRSSGLSVSNLSNLLLNLEMGGWIRQLPGNLYVRIKR